MRFITVIFITAFSLVNFSGAQQCLVETSLGRARGILELSRSQKSHCAFMGIPFAQPPQRFQLAEPLESWGEPILNATTLGTICPQIVEPGRVIGDENCLFLNVFYPVHEQCGARQLPVIVHIHGGSYAVGSGGRDGPKYFMDECVVYVSINYRLGAFGFMTTKDEVLPGNLGLKDQVLALKWVKSHIENFRGDSNAITITGISAGSGSVVHLLASPMAAGLFHRAVAQSGTVLNGWALSKNPRKYAHFLGDNLNCQANGSSDRLRDCLLSKTTEEIILAQDQVKEWNRDPVVQFSPIVEPYGTTNAFQTVNPYYRFLSGDFNHVPTIMGFLQTEGLVLQALLIMRNQTTAADLQERWNEVVPIHLMYRDSNLAEDESHRISQDIYDFYFKGGNLTLESLTDLDSDRFFLQAIFTTAHMLAKYTTVFPYVITYLGNWSFANTHGYFEPVITHGDDMRYFHNMDVIPPFEPGSADEDISKKLVKLWTSFAETGTPRDTWPDANIWTALVPEDETWFKIDTKIEPLKNYLSERRGFWSNLGLSRYDYFP